MVKEDVAITSCAAASKKQQDYVSGMLRVANYLSRLFARLS